jgi:hypothetical protein
MSDNSSEAKAREAVMTSGPLRPWERQPPPTPGREEVLPRVLAFLQERAAAGRQKYGTSLQTHNGRDPLIDLMQELGDALQYAMQEHIQRTDAYREGYEAGQKSAHSTPGDICRTCRTFGSVSCYPADVGRAILALQEAAKRGESRADKATAEAHAQQERAEAHFRETLAEVARERDRAENERNVARSDLMALRERLADKATAEASAEAEMLRKSRDYFQAQRRSAECERDGARAELRALREKLAELVNGKA